MEDVRKNYHAATLFLDKVLDSHLLKATWGDLTDDPDDDTAFGIDMEFITDR